MEPTTPPTPETIALAETIKVGFGGAVEFEGRHATIGGTDTHGAESKRAAAVRLREHAERDLFAARRLEAWAAHDEVMAHRAAEQAKANRKAMTAKRKANRPAWMN